MAISTGDIFRANVKGETPLGIETKKYMDNGDFVPDSVTKKVVRDRLSESDVENVFLLNGYPRTTAQVDYLDKILAKGEQKLDVVLQLTADDEDLSIGLWAGPRKRAGPTTTQPSSTTALTCTTDRPKPWSPSMPSAASSPR